MKITSYNCKGFKYRNFDYLKHLFNGCDILLLQETWLYEFENREFKKVLPECQYYAVSQMDDSDICRVGRPFGGCAILYHSNLTCSFSPIITASQRICAVVIKSETLNILMITVYMPCDDNSDQNFTIYGEILYEISNLIHLYGGYDIILGGNFNVDFDRTNSLNLSILKQFLADENLLCPTLTICENNWTFENSMGNRSFIDHFIVSANIFNCDITVSYDGFNLSDHNAVTLKTSHVSDTHSAKEYISTFNDWDNATDISIRDYKSVLDEYLMPFELPVSALNCNDFLCDKHDDVLIQKLDEFLNIIKFSADNSIPIKNKNRNKKGIPGCNSFVKPYKEKSIFWNDVWKNAGKPVDGQVAQLRRFSRTKYHWAVRVAKREANDTILNNTADQLMNKSFNQFWKSIKCMNGQEKVVSKVVDGQYTDQSIVNIFWDKYNKLYHSVIDNDFNDKINEVNKLVKEKCNKGRCQSSNSHSITLQIIKNVISSLNK